MPARTVTTASSGAGQGGIAIHSTRLQNPTADGHGDLATHSKRVPTLQHEPGGLDDIVFGDCVCGDYVLSM